MTTNGSYVNADPPCPAPMTRAALIALRNAGQLRTECHYIITDGPVIGTTGNTSPTVIELHAMSSNRLSLDCKVQTTFDPDTAWDGQYDIDLGTAGSIQRLTDLWNNTAFDSNADAPTVHTQFPWHAGSTNLQDNTVNDSVLPGWSGALAGGTMPIRDNEIKGSTVDLTGAGSAPSRFESCRITDSSFTSRAPVTIVALNNLDMATIENLSTSQFAFRNNTALTGDVRVNAGTTASLVSVIGNVFGGLSPFRVRINSATGSIAQFAGNRAFGQNGSGAGGQEVLISGSGDHTVQNNSLNAPNITINSSGNTQILGNVITGGSTVRGASTGPFQINECNLPGTTFTGSGSGAGTVVVMGGYMNESTVSVVQNSSGQLTVQQVDTNGATFTASASGSAAPTVSRGRILGATLNTGGFGIDVFDVVGGSQTLTANQSDRVRNALGSNLI